MALIIDTASAMRRLASEDFARWSQTRTVFLSSEMRELGDVRRVVGEALRAAGFTVVMFEDLGGRDEDAERAYLDGVARSDIYVGLLADRYGTMLPTGRSPTHEEYREARRLGKRISFWLQTDASNRQGNAVDFAQEVQVFHTTGQFRDRDDLSQRLLARLAEIAADDEAPWIKIGDACFRATVIRDEGATITVAAEVRDAAVARALESMRGDTWGRSSPVPIATAHRAGEATVTSVISEMRAASVRDIELRADVAWGEGRGSSMDASFNDLSPDDQVEAGLRAGLLGEALPQQVSSGFESMIDASDPLAPLDGLMLTPSTEEAIGALLVAERLLASGKASYIERFALGPPHLGERRVELVYVERQRYSNQQPGVRRIEGVRRTS